MEQFHFVGFEPSAEIRTRAQRLHSMLREKAPDCAIAAVLELSDGLYRCSIELGSRNYPIALSTAHRHPAIALDKAELSLDRRLQRRNSWLANHPLSEAMLVAAP